MHVSLAQTLPTISLSLLIFSVLERGKTKRTTKPFLQGSCFPRRAISSLGSSEASWQCHSSSLDQRILFYRPKFETISTRVDFVYIIAMSQTLEQQGNETGESVLQELLFYITCNIQTIYPVSTLHSILC